MSQHFLKFYHGPSGGDVRVQLGWDRPLQGFYMVALKNDHENLADDDDGIVYSNLLDIGHPHTQEHFRRVAKDLGFPIPDEMWRAAYMDSQHNASNRQSFYDLSGRLVEPF